MAPQGKLTEIGDLKTKYLSGLLKNAEVGEFYYRYDEDLDTVFYLFVDPDRETVTHPVDSNVGLLYDPETLEVVGITIEAFENQFLAQQDKQNPVWNLREAGLVLEEGAELAFKFGKTIPGWDKMAWKSETPTSNYREIDVPVPA
jgi:hypothetical protein